MPKVFQTEDDSVDRVEIVGAGVLHPGASGPGILVEDAARVLVELQDDKGKPLTGANLTTAARDFAEARGVRVVDMADAKRASAVEALGLPADRPPASEVAEEEYERTFAGLEPVNDDPEKVTRGGSDTGVTAAADSASNGSDD